MIVYGQYVSRMGIDENLTLKKIQDTGIIFPEKFSLVGFIVIWMINEFFAAQNYIVLLLFSILPRSGNLDAWTNS